MSGVCDPNSEETNTFRQMLQQPGDWVAVYDPDHDGNLSEWVKDMKQKYNIPSQAISLDMLEMPDMDAPK